MQSNEEVDKRLVNRETLRLELSIQDGIQKYGENKPIIVCMHYPPITNYNLQNQKKSPFMEIMKKYNVQKCIYGHLHAMAINDAIQGMVEGVELKLVSADSVDFKLQEI